MSNSNNKLALGFDIGTSGLKTVVLNPETGATVSCYSEWTLLTPEQGYAEFDCKDIWRHIVGCIKKLKELGVQLEAVGSVGFCALCPGLIAMGKDGQELTNSIIFMDARSKREAEFVNKTVPFEKSFPIIANRIMSGATSISTILWIKNNLPEIYESTKYFVHFPTWAGFKLTGKYVMDYSNASGTGLFDVHGQCWSETMAEAVGISLDKLPPLAPSVKLLGGLENNELISLGLSRGIPVSCGGGDTVCSLLALGVEPGDAMLSLGTSHVIYAVTEHDDFHSKLMSRSYVFSNKWAEGGAMSNPGVMLRWFRDSFCSDLIEQAEKCGRSAYELIDEEAAQSEIGSDGVICLPYINGERSPVYDSNARAVFHGISLTSKRSHIARSIMEGSAYGIRQLLELIELNTPISRIVCVGGGSKSAFMVQILSNVLNRSIEVSDMPDVGCIGAALTGLIAAGCTEYSLPRSSTRVFTPNAEAHEIYNSLYSKYLLLYPSLKNLF